jgi:chromate reductase
LKIVAVSGSLRAASVNTALLRAAIALAPPGVQIVVYDEVGKLPHFNPDVESDAPAVVRRWQELLLGCDAILIACPEYAHGLPGAFKNALDWVVGTVGLEGLPVALLNAAPRAQHAQAALGEIVVTMGWTIVEAASLSIPVGKAPFTGLDTSAADALRHALQAFEVAVREHAAS